MTRERKARRWVRLDCQGVLHGSINYLYTLEEQAVFIKMIAMAEVYGPEPGLISDNEKVSLPKEYIAYELHCSIEVLGSVLAKGTADKAIEENGSGIRLINFDHYQFTEYDRQKPYRKKPSLDNVEVKLKNKHGEFNNILLSQKEYDKLIEKFGEVKTKELIEELSVGVESKGYEYKSHYAAILNWDRRNQKDKEGKDGKNRRNPSELPKEYTKPEELLQD